MAPTRLSVVIAILCSITDCAAAEPNAARLSERHYQEKWCNEHGGVMEFRLDDGTRVDCLTDELAVEFDFAKKWAEAIGQARYYAAMTGKRGAVVLIVGPHDERYTQRLKIAAGADLDLRQMSKTE
jgi:hypothetical protein